MAMPSAGMILLAIAGILVALTVRGYSRDRQITSQYRTWLIISAIFVVVAVSVGV